MPPPTPPTRLDRTTQVENQVVARLVKEGNRKRRRARPSRANKENLAPLSDSEASDSEKEQTYQAYGRYLARVIDFSQIIDHIIETGIKCELEDDGSDGDGHGDENEDGERTVKTSVQRQLEDWNTICNKIAGFKEMIMTLAARRPVRHTLARHLTNGVEAACCDDRAALKSSLPTFILLDTKKTLDPAIATSGNKSDRGFYHPITAALLCPISLPATDETFKNVQDGHIVLNAKQLPRFLYPNDRTDTSGISDRVFEGYLMIRVAKFILIGRSCATSKPGASTGRRGNAALAEINTVTPRVVAYIAVQLHFALSSQSTWGLRDKGLFDYRKFYWNIVSFFEADKSGGQDILEYYNYHLWGDKAGRSSSAANANGDDHDSDDGDDGFALLVDERAAKRARAAADPFA
ncbi:hypothetical protein CCMSSC00406_0003897 [Pleurotus cornucopiae]|uniref:Uncharacterized protein n=1 Tax=Pleurotus cornucopiae TaxID=5321 RepID=A0ACB7IS38_PLECO|nr:hypothetical protein CCMSSC00406_0003897 [Pleurotus cornucopiae]